MREIEVHIDAGALVCKVGTLRVHQRGATFVYAAEWQTHDERFAIEPALHVGPGIVTPTGERSMFGAFGDSAPDTWGRRLMQRRERRAAKAEGRAIRSLTEADYLLGVADVARLGALRFRPVGEQEFLSPLTKGQPVPPFIELPRLLSVTERVLRDEETDEDFLLLFAPGSSLGGARPKASITDKDGHLAIAKFPKQDDEYSISAWEEVALTLADMAKIDVAAHRLEKVAGRDVLVSRRFDRVAGTGHRRAFLSAMSMLELKDGDKDNASYPYLVEALQEHGDKSGQDTRELFRRMVLSILISNVDDHLRNHGFVWEPNLKGWRLSPAYDLNPVPRDVKPGVLSTNISLDEATCSIDLARESGEEFFGLSLAEADAIILEVAEAAAQWRQVAQRLRIRPSEIERMASAFEHDEMKLALANRAVAARNGP